MGSTLRRNKRPPLYRDLERILAMVCEMTDRAYKRSKSLTLMNGDLIHDIREAISYAAIALNTEDENLKAQCITTIKIKMWVVSTTLERIYFSQANTRHHFLSEEQYGNIIDCMNAIDAAQERWQAKYTSTKDSHN